MQFAHTTVPFASQFLEIQELWPLYILIKEPCLQKSKSLSCTCTLLKPVPFASQLMKVEDSSFVSSSFHMIREQLSAFMIFLCTLLTPAPFASAPFASIPCASQRMKDCRRTLKSSAWGQGMDCIVHAWVIHVQHALFQ